MEDSRYTFSAEARRLAQNIITQGPRATNKAGLQMARERFRELIQLDGRPEVVAALHPLMSLPLNPQKDTLWAAVSRTAYVVNGATVQENEAIYKAEAPARWMKRNAERLASARESIQAWAAKLGQADDPYYEMRWSVDVFDQAGEFRARTLAARFSAIGAGVALTALREELRRQAREGWSSSSVAHNLAEDRYRMALARLVEELERNEIEAEDYPPGGITWDEQAGSYVAKQVLEARADAPVLS